MNLSVKEIKEIIESQKLIVTNHKTGILKAEEKILNYSRKLAFAKLREKLLLIPPLSIEYPLSFTFEDRRDFCFDPSKYQARVPLVYPGEFITVVEWKGSTDKSFEGDCLEVKVVDLPFIRVTCRQGVLKRITITLNLDKVKIKKFSEAFVADVLKQGEK